MDLYSKEKRSEYNKAYYKRNKERIDSSRVGYALANRAQKRFYEREKYRNDPVYRNNRKRICAESKKRLRLKEETSIAVPVTVVA